MADISEPRSKKPLLNTTRAQKGMTLKAIAKATPIYIKRLARDQIVIKKLSRVWTKGGMRAVQAIAVNMEKRVTTPHKVTIIGLDAKYGTKTGLKKNQIPLLFKQKRIQVDCECDFFKFVCEYALWAHGAAKIRRCNGEFPTIKNPGLVPLGCKHIYAVLKELNENGF